MAGVDEKWSIDKLDGANWNTWKFQMRHILLAKGLCGVVDGSEMCPEDATEHMRAKLQQRLQIAFSTIVMAISTPQLYLVTTCKELKDVWDVLHNHFEQETLANNL